jgi:fimbrial chaperone protein
MAFRKAALACLSVATLFGGARISMAAQLRVEPILLEMNAPAASGTLMLHNDGDTEIAVQTRVLRWSQADGKETLETTTDVVASPPIARLTPGGDYVVRVVRVSKQPVQGEESYRVIVDQLPNFRLRKDRVVNLLIRQSIPVFFRNPQLSAPSVVWSFNNRDGKLFVLASNSGDERLRIASLRLRDAAGLTVFFGNGLVGYVLGRSSMSWIVPSPQSNFGLSGSASITAQSDKGPINAVAQISDRR